MLRALLVAAGFVVLTVLLVGALLLLRAFKWPGRGAISIAYSRAVSALLGMRVRVQGRPVNGKPVLVVANHVSWADIIAITATTPSIFVAKREVASWPLIGLVAKARGTVFVDRERRHQTSDANADIAARLAEGAVIVLFGEGTSGDGNRILPFRSSLLGAVNLALRDLSIDDIAIQPLAISYTGIRGLPMGRQHRPIAAWYGDADLVSHVRGFLTRGPVDVTLSWGEPLMLEGHVDRKSLTRTLEGNVRQLARQALAGRAHA